MSAMKKMITAVRIICFTILLSVFSFRAAAEDFTNAIHAFLQHRAEIEKKPGGIVVGIVDEHGSSIISYGKLDGGTDQEVNGDTVFALHSGTCTFTALLLQDMIARGEMNLDDPVAKYLPKSVKMPSHNGKEITLRHLVTETSSLPNFGDKLHPKRADNPFGDYTVEKMYAFLSDYQLGCDPGVYYGHGGVAMGLLGHVIALKAGTNYESLVVDRICRPLKMDSTRVTLTPGLKSRLMTEYNSIGYPTAWADMDWGVLAPLGGLHSTANDLLKFVSALGRTPSSLTPLMEKSLALIPDASQGSGIILFGGGGFDTTLRRCVVIRSATVPDLDHRKLCKFLLESEWQSERRPKETKISSQVYGLYAGQYERSPDLALGMFALRQFKVPRAAIYTPAGLGLVVLVVLLWRAGTSRKRWLILGGAVLVGGVLATLIPLVSSRIFCARFQPGIGIHREGDQLFAQPTGLNLWPIADWKFAQRMGLGVNPIDVMVPPVQAELLPESETRFFERLSGIPMIFSRDAQGKVTGLTVHYQGKVISYDKISDQPPKAPEPLKRPVVIKLDAKLLDAVVGHYECAPDAVFPTLGKVTIWREGDHLVGEASDKNGGAGAFDVCPESETNFFDKTSGAQLTFIKNDKGEVTAVIHHSARAGVPDAGGKKLKE